VKWDSPGTFRWTIKDGARTHVNAMRTWNGWHGGERMRPKWGIYRNRGSAGLQNTHILLDHFRAYQKE
jgi:chitin-binding protein